jgi:hypothetical protein
MIDPKTGKEKKFPYTKAGKAAAAKAKAKAKAKRGAKKKGSKKKPAARVARKRGKY